MLLTITTTRAPATDLGFLLHKHPAKVQAFDTSTGTAHVFYPEATEHRSHTRRRRHPHSIARADANAKHTAFSRPLGPR